MTNIKIGIIAAIAVLAIFLFGRYQDKLQLTDTQPPYITPEEAYQWGALMAIGHIGDRGKIEQDRKDAAVALQFAAENGHAKAAAELGRLYEKGYGVKKDIPKALKWYEKAVFNEVNLGDDSLMVLVSICDLYRNSSPPDYSKALTFCQRATRYAYPSAQARLSDFYYNGWGVEKDIVEAYFWRKLANYWISSPDEVGLDLAKEQNLSLLIAEQDKQKITARVHSWIPKDPPRSGTIQDRERCENLVRQRRIQEPVSDTIAENCMSRCLHDLHKPDPRYTSEKSCPFWKRLNER